MQYTNDVNILEQRAVLTSAFRECQSFGQLNEVTYAIAKQLKAQPPDRGTVLVLISAMKGDPCWDGNTNPFEGLLTTAVA